MLPTGISFLTHNLPLVMTSRGVYFPKELRLPEKVVYRGSDFRFIAYDTIDHIRTEGKEVYINDTLTLRTTSSIGARSIEHALNELVSLAADRRSKKIDSILKERINAAGLRGRFDAYQRYFVRLALPCTLMFVLLFIVLPLSIYTKFNLYVPLGFSVAGIVGTYLIIIGLTYLTHRKIFPGEPLERAYVIFSITVSPVAAAHAVHYLTKPFFADDHFAAVAAEFMPLDRFREEVRKEILIAAYSKSGNSDPEWALFWAQKARALRRLANGKGVSISEIMAPLMRQDESAVCYCPFCRVEYQTLQNKCHDCDVKLVEYAQDVH